MFRKTQLNNTKCYPVDKAQSLRFEKNVLPSTVSLSKQKQLASSEKRISTTSDMGFPDTLTSDTPVLASSPALAFTNKFFKQFMKSYSKTQTSAAV